MGTALQKAISLILSSDAELLNILKVTAQMSLKSSLLALLLGVPLGICLGNSKFPGRGLLIILNRTLMGMPPVVCGLLFYILFSGVGPLRHMKLLFTVITIAAGYRGGEIVPTFFVGAAFGAVLCGGSVSGDSGNSQGVGAGKRKDVFAAVQ